MNPISRPEELVLYRRTIYGSFDPGTLVKAKGFSNVLGGCISNSEPFLFHLQSYRDEAGKVKYHQEILDLDTAKSLVYYRKNKKFMGALSTKQLLVLLERIERSNAEWAKNKTKAIDYIGKIYSMIRKQNEEEIPF
jgi:hypothetical protein